MPQLSLPSYQPYVPSEAPEAETSMLAREAFRAGVSLSPDDLLYSICLQIGSTSAGQQASIAVY